MEFQEQYVDHSGSSSLLLVFLKKRKNTCIFALPLHVLRSVFPSRDVTFIRVECIGYQACGPRLQCYGRMVVWDIFQAV